MFGLVEGELITIGELETHVTGFNTVAGEVMVSTPYGDFHPDLVRKLNYSEVAKLIDKEIDYHTGGEEMKSLSEIMTDDHIVKVLKRIKEKL